ncbi:hypothetical protein K7432_017031 [Basidiobolus ranarum]|uniref:Uncharacterized protein n=1 Tax=Basidiobolus ranarum TaxID=34480 RepID=A0ABR2VKV6_9FUNG
MSRLSLSPKGEFDDIVNLETDLLPIMGKDIPNTDEMFQPVIDEEVLPDQIDEVMEIFIRYP